MRLALLRVSLFAVALGSTAAAQPWDPTSLAAGPPDRLHHHRCTWMSVDISPDGRTDASTCSGTYQMRATGRRA
jgi:hypothetical protein